MKKMILVLAGIFASIGIFADGANFTWNCNTEPDLAGYRLYQGITSGVYTSFTPVPVNCTTGKASFSIPSLNPGTYFWAVTAYDTSNNQSGPSNEVSKTISGNQTILAQFNFTTPTGPVVPGYTNDSGAGFTIAKGYGWSTGWMQTVDSRVRGMGGVDPKLDSFVFCNTGFNCTFTYNVPNGNYTLTWADGDSQFGQGPHKVTIEGQVIVNNVSTTANQFITKTDVPVTVNDGNITLALGGTGAGTTCLNYLIIKSAGAAPPPDTTPPSQPNSLTITSVNIRWNASTDNVGVTAYRVLDNGTQVLQVTGTTALLALASGIHNISIQAIDAAGNISTASAPLPITVP